MLTMYSKIVLIVEEEDLLIQGTIKEVNIVMTASGQLGLVLYATTLDTNLKMAKDANEDYFEKPYILPATTYHAIVHDRVEF